MTVPPVRRSRLYRLRNRPVCGLPVGTTALVRRSAASRLVGVTTKRRMVRFALRIAATLPDRLSLVPLRPLECLHGLTGLEAVLDIVGVDGSSWPAIFWPSQFERARAYVHLLDQEGRPRGFLKLAQARDASALFRERDALLIWNGGRGIVRTPKVISSGTDRLSGAAWLLVEPLPTGSRPLGRVPTEALLAEINGTRRDVAQPHLHKLTWWPALQERLPQAPATFREVLERISSSGVSVSPTHGDLGAHNMVSDGLRLWVYDWEDATPDAPADTDRFGINLFGTQPSEALRRAAALPESQQESFVWSCAFGWANRVGKWPSIVSMWDNWEGTLREL